ncbi:fluoride efflux transporter CrcB [Methylorubrum thiocyanatum]|uniref:Fluoride-specific ion channel FluC n=1 Tax=Methylorubrum thiocyanatum TaxID=47958 RepID=A0AA40S488_9HYPH|nr:fluoride efflux transporter CrcB [Methylorubrum thiocyanatum]MBA8914133.1 CrcB protein [Methylorubrum thiocyanatum]GJE79098.1 Putative fluoride ion transporter CrcB [Methylorubrum thiocyanatum]
MDFLIVMLGAGLGGGARHGVNLSVARVLPSLDFPLATPLINVLGSFLMGMLAEAFVLRGADGHPLKLLITTGVLGGFTTFSTFSLDAISLYDRGRLPAAAYYLVLSVAGGLVGLVAGLALARAALGGGVS